MRANRVAGPTARLAGAAALAAIAAGSVFGGGIDAFPRGEQSATQGTNSPGDPFADWSVGGLTALAGVGLVAVAAGAASMRRPRTGPKANRPCMLDVPLLVPTAFTQAPSPGAPPPVQQGGEEPDGAADRVAPEAHVYLALHHVDLAISVLRDHVDRGEPATPVVWLMLLDLYRTHGKEQAFRELAGRFHGRFNARTPEWNRFPPGETEPGLEAFPRLIKEIALAWGTHECRRLIDRLLHDNRNGLRTGFTLHAYNDLLALRELSESLLATIAADHAEEAVLRSAFAAATAELVASGPRRDGARANPSAAANCGSDRASPRHASGESPLGFELQAQLDGDLREPVADQSTLEIEHPALAGMLTREWGKSAQASRLCKRLWLSAHDEDGLSDEARAELQLLHVVAASLWEQSGIEGAEPVATSSN